MTGRLTCQCPGSPLGDPVQPCPDLITQEDGLCDPCRVRDCPTITTHAIADERDRLWMLHVDELLKLI